ncbi:MAG: ABC transporter permease [Eubacteriales bacterium]
MPVKKRIKIKSKKKQKKLQITRVGGISIFTVIMLLMAMRIAFHHNPLANPEEELMKKVIACIIILVAIVVFAVFYDKIMILPKELYQSRRLIWKLAKNDFKKRYAGSYLGAVWAMIQPVVTVGMYYIVFDKIFQTRSQMIAGGIEVPYVLFLTAGLVPWFYFSEALTSGMTALIEYNYLVKKVVFKISILPIIKIIAATFIHVFFVCILLIVGSCYGYYPSVYTIQLFYYSFCLFVLVLAISYSTCAIVVFFKDLQQIVGIVLQIGMWATPILWDIQLLGDTAELFIKMNPLVYIVNGYRTSIYDHQWFFEDFYSTMYFWIITVVIFVIGAILFKRLKTHFADVM